MVGGISVIVLQPYPILREGLVRVLSESSGMNCIGFGSVPEIGAVAVDVSKRVIFLVDLGQDSSAETQGIVSLKERFPDCAVVVLSEQYSQCHLLNALESGACGYLTKDIGCETLIKYLELVAQGERVFPTQALQLLYSKEFLNTCKAQVVAEPQRILSGREVEVIRCLSQGKSNKFIARQWGISEATVKVHVKAILRKIDLKNRTEAALWARDHGISVEQALPSVNGPPPALPEPKSHQR
jgi:two-component system, NarL family, nitrate/nitrite response regulator NarL